MDERIILKEKLISIGITNQAASQIALEAGSSQCVVNNSYLKGLSIEKNMRKLAMRFINQFYRGEN
jgi:hypothetical protein